MLDADLLRRAAANIETMAQAEYEAFCLQTRSSMGPDRWASNKSYERYARLARVAKSILDLLEVAHAR